MRLPVEGPMDLPSTLLSGSAFRWQRDGEWLVGVAFENVIRARQTAGGIEFECAPEDEESVAPRLRDYLSLDVDLEAVYASIGADGRVREAIERYRGMRLLRQEPWECLASFIISAYSNVARISRHVRDLSARYGRRLAVGGEAWHAFPRPEALAEAGEAGLRALGLGYRAPYLAGTARIVAEGGINPVALRQAGYDETLEALTALPGVGEKVANCVMLFSLDRLDAFPADVWVARAVREWYGVGGDKGLPPWRVREWGRRRFGEYAGYANHYLFHARREAGHAAGGRAAATSAPLHRV